MIDETAATVAMSEFELLMCRSMCGDALRRLGDDAGVGDIEDVFGQMTDGQRDIVSIALRVMRERFRAVLGEHHVWES